jgi:hypothetical protein
VIGVGTLRTRTDVEGGKLESGELAQWNDTAGPAGVGDADGGGVVMACDVPLVRGGGAVARVGAVWLVQIGFAGRHFEMVRFAVGGLAGCDVVTGVVTLMVLERFG